ncbi:MAG: extracellular solute-binding protein [Lachnospiraceae bacterium]|nr:extracellular solute-binding protein [Lachnospiraceae bacterium]
MKCRSKNNSLILIAMLVLLLTGCAGKENEVTEVTLMHGWGGTLETHKIMQEIYDDFAKENPDIILNCVSYSDSSIAVERANDMLAVGKMPDIISTNGLSYFVQHSVERGMALDLMTYIEKDEELGKMIHPSVYTTWETSGHHLYTVPDALEVAGFWYNRKYMEQAGLTNAAGEVREPEDWNEFLEMMDTMKQWTQTQKNISVCSLENLQMTEFLFPARLAAEGDMGWNMATSASFHGDGSTLLQVMTDLDRIEKLSKKVDNIESARQDFMDGKSILYFNGIWESNALVDNGADFGYGVYPFDENNKLAYVSASSGYVFAKQENAQKEEACIRFLKYMLSTEVQQELAVKTGQMPSNPNVSLDKVEEQNAILADAIDKVYSADKQIKMIRSVWSENKMTVLEKYVKKDEYNQENIAAMARQLESAE